MCHECHKLAFYAVLSRRDAYLAKAVQLGLVVSRERRVLKPRRLVVLPRLNLNHIIILLELTEFLFEQNRNVISSFIPVPLGCFLL